MYVYSSLFFLVIDLNRRFLHTRGNRWDNRNRCERLQRLVEWFSKQMEDMVCAFQQWCFRMKDARLSDGISPLNDEAVEGTARIILFDTHREWLYPVVRVDKVDKWRYCKYNLYYACNRQSCRICIGPARDDPERPLCSFLCRVHSCTGTVPEPSQQVSALINPAFYEGLTRHSWCKTPSPIRNCSNLMLFYYRYRSSRIMQQSSPHVTTCT